MNKAQEYRTRQISVYALQWRGDNEHELIDWLDDVASMGECVHANASGTNELRLRMGTHDVDVQPGEWVTMVKVEGFWKFGKCTQEEFVARYEPA